jgi:TRAP-type C4-dicarboxylate transport system substrate-binding protein
VIDGAVIPYEVSVILKMSELTDGHTGFESSPGLYTATFGILMNKARYEGLPDDLKAIIDQHSGVTLARVAGQAMDRADEVGIKIARDAGNEVVVLDDAQKTKWIDAAQPVFAAWVAEMDAIGIDGAELLAKARAEIAKAK